MRADAMANREKLLDAASAVFAERGIDAPLTLLPERANLGKGTLYRHFADRDAVILGLAARLRIRFAGIVEAADAAESGWDAIVTYIDGATAMYLDLPWLGAVRARARQLAPSDGRFELAVRLVIERARAEGSLRADVDPTDVVFAPAMLAGFVDLPEPMRSVVMARQRDIILDGLRAPGVPRPQLGGNPLTIERLRAYTDGDADSSADVTASGA
ncbi:TetR/AcrR family transcriptional regulator [Microbacterium sp. cf046]|uniref:TetR/AcrR family transcriptional regulator n=1 Tax=Microbacterium sp. cf046 TaxID=1761803 RepID=UPI0015879593|nr:TetR/AcrR family transcriptional regulator [Microbacterium sp. cf046]